MAEVERPARCRAPRGCPATCFAEGLPVVLALARHQQRPRSRSARPAGRTPRMTATTTPAARHWPRAAAPDHSTPSSDHSRAEQDQQADRATRRRPCCPSWPAGPGRPERRGDPPAAASRRAAPGRRSRAAARAGAVPVARPTGLRRPRAGGAWAAGARRRRWRRPQAWAGAADPRRLPAGSRAGAGCWASLAAPRGGALGPSPPLLRSGPPWPYPGAVAEWPGRQPDRSTRSRLARGGRRPRALEHLAARRGAGSAGRAPAPPAGRSPPERDLHAEQALLGPVDVVELEQQRRLVERQAHAGAERAAPASGSRSRRESRSRRRPTTNASTIPGTKWWMWRRPTRHVAKRPDPAAGRGAGRRSIRARDER